MPKNFPGTGTHRSLVARTNMCGWAIILCEFFAKIKGEVFLKGGPTVGVILWTILIIAFIQQKSTTFGSPRHSGVNIVIRRPPTLEESVV